MKRLLIISPHFPPVNAPDMQRVRVSLPFFVEAGWGVSVLTVDDPTPVAPLEPELIPTIPREVKIERTFCFSRRWTGILGINNVALRSLPFLFWRGCSLLRQRRYDVVYFSTTMFLVLPFGRLWKRLYGVPYVIDLQDPWVSDYYSGPGRAPPPGGWKYGFAQWQARALEGWTMRKVAHLITVSAGYSKALRTRYTWLRNTPATELPFGSPDPDLAHLKATLATRPRLLPREGIRLAFAGAIGPGMLAAVEVFLAALAKLRRAGLPLSAYFFGTSYSAQGRGKPVLHALVAQYDLQDCVHESPDRLRYFDALQVTLEADVNLLFGSTDLAYIPSKLLATCAAGRPVLAVAPAGSAVGPRLDQLGQPHVTISGSGTDEANVRETATQLHSLATNHSPVAPNVILERYSARAVAMRQLEILAGVSDA